MGVSGATWYWNAAVGNSGLQTLPTIGQPRDWLRDQLWDVGSRWSTQRAPTLVVMRSRGFVGVFCDALRTGTRDTQRRPMRADMIVVAHDAEARGAVEAALGCFLAGTGPHFELADGVPALAPDWPETMPTLPSAMKHAEWPAGRVQTIVKDRESVAALVLALSLDDALLRETAGPLALFSDWLDEPALESLGAFRVLGGPELKPRSQSLPKDQGEPRADGLPSSQEVSDSRGPAPSRWIWILAAAILTVSLAALLVR